MIKAAVMTSDSDDNQETRRICHAINNRMNSLVIGMSVLENHASNDVRDIAQILHGDLEELQELLATLKAKRQTC